MMRSVLLIITGSVAAYKALDLIRLLSRRGIKTTAILTAGGSEFITPLAVSSLTGTVTYSDLFSLKDETEMGHIRLAREHDAIVVVPASADFIAKLASGRADDLASATVLAADVPVWVAPAMNHRMWQHPATQRNIQQLRADGVRLIAPTEGEMACGEYGVGRLAEPEAVLAALTSEKNVAGAVQPAPARAAMPETGSEFHAASEQPLIGRRILVTSGPTREPLDPVRFLSNQSSGKQGHAIAAAMAAAGADVTLVSGPVELPAPPGVKLVRVNTAEQMHAACIRELPVDVAVCAAAVSDWTVTTPAERKIKKRNSKDVPTIAFTPTPDILASLAQHPQQRPQIVIGFAAETENLLENAKHKCARKRCDWILANDVSNGNVFGQDDTHLTLVGLRSSEPWGRISKVGAAEKLVALVTSSFKLPQNRKARPEFPFTAPVPLEELTTNSARARQMAAQGMRKSDIARQLGISYSHVLNAVKPSTRKEKTQALEVGLVTAANDLQKIRLLRASGLTPMKIAKKLGKDAAEVKAALKKKRKKPAGKRKEANPRPVSQHPAIAPEAIEQIRQDPSFPTQSARIRHMASLGMSRSEIAKALNIRYQNVQSALVPPKKNSQKIRSSH